MANQLRQTPLGRIGQPHDIAAAVAFLASPDSTWITGAIIMVSGRPLLIVTTPRRNSQRSQRKVAFYDSDGELMTISDEVCPIRMFKRCLPVTRYMVRRDLSKDDIPPSYVCFSSQEDCGPKG